MVVFTVGSEIRRISEISMSVFGREYSEYDDPPAYHSRASLQPLHLRLLTPINSLYADSIS